MDFDPWWYPYYQIFGIFLTMLFYVDINIYGMAYAFGFSEVTKGVERDAEV